MSNFKRYYQNNNLVFVTIVTYNRQPILIDNIEKLRNAFKFVKYEYKIIAAVVLPDHMHLIIQTQNAGDFSKIITYVKANFSKMMPKNLNQTIEQMNRREKGVWQRKYYDHIIRDENDFNRHLDYIHYNSCKHLQINPKDWEYSSFNKFVQQGFYDMDWCNFGDKNNISTMNPE